MPSNDSYIMILEVCANSYQSAINAQIAGAHRIELCQELHVGGLSPTIEMFKKVKQELTIPVYVLIRPRAGNFMYSAEEFELLLNQIETFKNHGANGIVCGALNEDNTINQEQTKQLIEASRPLSFTFHRAFDEVSNPIEAVHILASLGVNRILTSGQKTTAVEGVELLKKLKVTSNNIVILPGAGIRPDNVEVFRDLGFQEIHASCSKPIQFNGKTTSVSDLETIKTVLARIES